MYQSLKRGFDLVMSLLGIVVTCPLWLFAAVGIWLSDPGPVFYLANRVGKDGKTFRMFKFRSMRQKRGADETMLKADGNRIFAFGKLLRATKIDELPQLINIVRGEMSVVGPRPASVDQIDLVRCGKYAIASTVSAGLTGPSALYDYIYGDSISDEDEYRQSVLPTRLELDAWYVEHMSIRLDLKMIWWTVVCILAEVFHKETPQIYNWLVAQVETERETAKT